MTPLCASPNIRHGQGTTRIPLPCPVHPTHCMGTCSVHPCPAPDSTRCICSALRQHPALSSAPFSACCTTHPILKPHPIPATWPPQQQPAPSCCATTAFFLVFQGPASACLCRSILVEPPRHPLLECCKPKGSISVHFLWCAQLPSALLAAAAHATAQPPSMDASFGCLYHSFLKITVLYQSCALGAF